MSRCATSSSGSTRWRLADPVPRTGADAMRAAEEKGSASRPDAGGITDHVVPVKPWTGPGDRGSQILAPRFK
jgi:hypothetical protein